MAETYKKHSSSFSGASSHTVKFNTLRPNPLKSWFSDSGIFRKFRFFTSELRKNSAPFRPFIAPNGSTHEYSIQSRTVSERPHQAPVTSKITPQPPVGFKGSLGFKVLRVHLGWGPNGTIFMVFQMVPFIPGVVQETHGPIEFYFQFFYKFFV